MLTEPELTALEDGLSRAYAGDSRLKLLLAEYRNLRGQHRAALRDLAHRRNQLERYEAEHGKLRQAPAGAERTDR